LNVVAPKTGFASSALPGEQGNGIGSPPRYYIDNQALEGFMGFFRKQDCSSGCDHCGYCQRIADKAIQFDSDEVDGYVAALNETLDNLSSSRVFKVGVAAKKPLR
jgi:hypothetical protein